MTLGQEITFDYAGLLCLILLFSSFFQRLRSNRKKLVDGLILLFFAASVFFTPLYKLWHFLSMPYGFPTRFSFVIVFWLIAAAAGRVGHARQKVAGLRGAWGLASVGREWNDDAAGQADYRRVHRRDHGRC